LAASRVKRIPDEASFHHGTLLTPSSPKAGPEDHEGWQVGRISQEHGILTWNGDRAPLPLVIEQKVRIFPNRACVAGACFDWYLVFDSDKSGSENRIVDGWPRWRGW
jgi:D-serine deaminase-like pyridoxal phosphate-dependent protein